MSTSEQDTFELLTLTVEVDEKGSTIYRNAEGQVHRLFGPAMIYSDGDDTWHWRGMWHRVGGLASWTGAHYLFDKWLIKEDYDLECINKTNPLWKEYDAELQQYA